MDILTTGQDGMVELPNPISSKRIIRLAKMNRDDILPGLNPPRVVYSAQLPGSGDRVAFLRRASGDEGLVIIDDHDKKGKLIGRIIVVMSPHTKQDTIDDTVHTTPNEAKTLVARISESGLSYTENGVTTQDKNLDLIVEAAVVGAERYYARRLELKSVVDDLYSKYANMSPAEFTNKAQELQDRGVKLSRTKQEGGYTITATGTNSFAHDFPPQVTINQRQLNYCAPDEEGYDNYRLISGGEKLGGVVMQIRVNKGSSVGDRDFAKVSEEQQIVIEPQFFLGALEQLGV